MVAPIGPAKPPYLLRPDEQLIEAPNSPVRKCPVGGRFCGYDLVHVSGLCRFCSGQRMGDSIMTVGVKRIATASIALVSASAIAIAPTVQAPPRAAVPVVHLAAATSQKWGWPPAQQPNLAQQSTLARQPQAPAQQSNALGALFSLDLGRFIIPPSAGQSFPTPPKIPGPSPAPTDFEFEDAIINTYHAIEPWVCYGFEVATYAVGWIPWGAGSRLRS